MRTLAIDIETYSAADLGKVGVYRYSEDPSFEILLFAYAWDDEPVQIVDLACGEEIPEDVFHAIGDENVLKTAYNAQFERVCLSRYTVYTFDLDEFAEDFLNPESWSCTAVQARAAGYPNRLGDVTTALGFGADKAKDRRGKALITYFCSPCKPTKVNGGRTRNLPRHDPEKWKIFKEYCCQDVEAERAVRKCLPQIPESEQKLYEIDQRINDRGVRIDRRVVEAAASLGQSHLDGVADDARHVTGLDNLNALGAVKDWLRSKGINADTLRKADVERLLAEVDDPEVTAYLRARQELGKTSTTKYDAMLRCACQDDRVRGTLMFCGAGRTGRWAGRLIQTQNLPRNEIEDLPFARQLVMERDARSIEMIYGPVTHVLSQLIRTALVPSDGCHFTVADFSAIEARVIAWLADEDWRTEVFRNHGDIYCASASQMFKVPVEKHGVNGHLRQKGKIAELALGYGGGPAALKAFGADKMGLSDAEMQEIVTQWRAASPHIVRYWWNVDRAAKQAIQTGRTTQLLHGVKIGYRDGALVIALPSERLLRYPGAVVAEDRIHFLSPGSSGVMLDTETYGPRLVENIVQATARDCLAALLHDLDADGASIVFHVHDEVIIEVQNGLHRLDKMLAFMREPPWWADGLILEGDGYECEFYQKD
jgi:DNA polymerase